MAVPLSLSMITSQQFDFMTLFLPQFSVYSGPLLLTGVGHFAHEDGDAVLLVDDEEDERPVHRHVLLLPEVGAEQGDLHTRGGSALCALLSHLETSSAVLQ